MKDKGLFIGLIFFSIFVLFFGFFKIKESIEGPFRLPKLPVVALTNEEIQKVLETKDTDQDGLTDSDEVFKYHTSIYLADSDSDGYNDKEEVEKGSDPVNSESTPLKKIAETPKIEEKKEPTIEEIRNLLIRVGIPKETLDRVDDETLKKLYNETVKETGIDLEELKRQVGGLSSFGQIDFSKIIQEYQELPTQPTTNQSLPEILTSFENLEPATIRQLMLAAGADQSLLNQIDDQTLKTLFLQILRETQP